jgi:hypothetical protein
VQVWAAGTISTNMFLRRLHNYATGMHFLPWPVNAERATLALASLDFLKGWIELILVASTRSGATGHNRFPNVLKSFEEWMKTACVEFKLGNEIKTVLREWGYDFDVLDVSVESLRADKKFAKHRASKIPRNTRIQTGFHFLGIGCNHGGCS